MENWGSSTTSSTWLGKEIIEGMGEVFWTCLDGRTIAWPRSTTFGLGEEWAFEASFIAEIRCETVGRPGGGGGLLLGMVIVVGLYHLFSDEEAREDENSREDCHDDG